MQGITDSPQCKETSKAGWKCNIREGHGGKVHVAFGLSNRVVEVWKTVEEPTEKVLFLVEEY